MKKYFSFSFSIFVLNIFVPNIIPQWIQTNGHFGAGNNVWTMVVSDQNLFAGTSGAGIFLSTDNGVSWIEKNSGLTNLTITKLVKKDTNIFVGTKQGIFVSSDNGNFWKAVNNGLPFNWTNVGERQINIRTIITDGTNIFAGLNGGMYLSSDDGANWIERKNGLPNEVVEALAIKDNDLFAGTFWSFNPLKGGHVSSSSNNGTNWRQVSNGLPDEIVLDLTVTEKNIFVAFDEYRGIYRSSDKGENWHSANSMLPARLPRCLISHKWENVNYLLIGNLNYPAQNAEPEPIYFSTNEGDSWISISEGLTNSAVWSLTISDQYLYAGVDSTVWRRPLDEILGINEVSFQEFPITFDITQNYPNPFNPTTVINYSIPNKSNVSLIIYDALGREVAKLVNEEKPAGNYSIEFSAKGGSTSGGNAANLSSGIYFYQIRAGDFVQTKKMVFLR